MVDLEDGDEDVSTVGRATPLYACVSTATMRTTTALHVHYTIES